MSALSLSVDEKIELSHLEKQIESGLAKVEAGLRDLWKAFVEIREKRLYRASHNTFEDYCRDRWDKGRNYINKLIAAGEIICQVEHVLGTTVPISTEWQTRPLKALNAEERPLAVEASVAIAANERPTTSEISRAVAAVKSKPAPFAPGQSVQVLDESSELYGQTVTVLKTEGVLATVATLEGEPVDRPFLVNEIGNETQPKAIAPVAAKPKHDPIADIMARAEMAELRNTVLEQMINRMVQAIRSGSINKALLEEAEALLA